MPFVLDASVASVWAFADEEHPIAAMAFEWLRTDTAIAPALWWFEVRNTLIVNERRGRITEAATAIFLRDLGRLPISLDRAPIASDLISLARRRRLTVYDAAYLELAKRERVALATLDKALAKAADDENVGLLDEDPD